MSRSAAAYVRAEAACPRRRSPAAAQAFVRHLALARERLTAFDMPGFEAGESLLPGARRLIVQDHIPDYETERTVTVPAIRHGRQMLPVFQADDIDDYEST